MPKSFYKVLLTVFVVIISIYIIGLRKDSEINAELEVRLPFAKDYVYSIYTDIYNYPNRKRNLENIEVTDKTSNKILSWIENYKNGSRLEYMITSKSEGNYFDYEVYNVITRDTSKITSTFKEDDDFTYIYLEEEGRIENKFKRGIRFLLGDNYSLKKEAKWLRVAIMQEQIDRK